MDTNAPVLTITLPNLQRTLYRCGECAGPVPPDLPERIATEAIETKLARLRDMNLNRVAEFVMPEPARREWLAYKDAD